MNCHIWMWIYGFIGYFFGLLVALCIACKRIDAAYAQGRLFA